MSATIAHRAKHGMSGAGLFAGPAAWAINTQVGYAAVPWACPRSDVVIAVIAVLMACVALAGAYLSWRAWRPAPLTPEEQAAGGRPYRMLALAGVGSGILFAVLILAQAAGTLFLHACER
jgi:hypothetical protein